MPVANPHYNPDWEAIHDYHAAYRTQIQIASSVSGGHSDEFPFRFSSARRDYEFHNKVCLHLLYWVQHKTVQDFAKWLFIDNGYNLDITNVPPFEELTSMEEVSAIYGSLIDQKYKELYADESASDTCNALEEPTAAFSDRPNLALGTPSVWDRITGIFH